MLIITGLFGISLVVLLVNHFSMKKWEKKATDERDHARIVAFTDPLTGVKSKNAFTVQEDEMESNIKNGEADEFVVLLKRYGILKDINAKIEENIDSDRVVASLGLAEYVPETDASFHEVFKRADGLMYERKTQLKSMGAVTRD